MTTLPQSAANAYPWPEGKRCAVLVSSDVDGEAPYIWRHRGRPIDLIEALEQRRFGPRAGAWRILDMLDELGVAASFYVPGYIAETYPALLPAMVARGHEVGLHGWYHENPAELSADENAAVIDRCLRLFDEQLEVTPGGYRAPFWHVTAELLGLLRKRGFVYDSSLAGWDHPYRIEGVIEVPVIPLVADTTYFRVTGGPDDKSFPPSPRHVLEIWMDAFEAVRNAGGLFTITIHPWICGQSPLLRLLRALLDHLRQYEDVWWATALEIAQHHVRADSTRKWDCKLSVPDTNF